MRDGRCEGGELKYARIARGETGRAFTAKAFPGLPPHVEGCRERCLVLRVVSINGLRPR
jgi:hypothetical protein